MSKRVILINTAAGELSRGLNAIGPAEQNLGLVAIAEGLEAEGHGEYRLLPSQQTRLTSGLRGNPLFEEIARAAAGAEELLFGFSLLSSDVEKFDVLSAQVRTAFPHAEIVAGGPHFRPERLRDETGKPVRNTIELALAKGQADLVVAGHGQPFIDYVLGEQEGAGTYRTTFDARAKREYGSFPRGALPVSLFQAPANSRVRELFGIDYVDEIKASLDDTCRNACNFCSIFRVPTRLDVDASFEKIAPLLRPRPQELILEESNPLEPRKIGLYDELLTRLQEVNPHLMISLYVDPGLLVRDFDRHLAFITAHNVRSLFIGRDAVTEQDATTIGSKYRGRHREQAELDAEGEAITRLVYGLEMIAEADPMRRTSNVRLSYVAHPFMNRAAQTSLIEDAYRFSVLPRSKTGISINLCALTPYPGTPIREEFASHLLEPEEFGFFEHRPHWNPALPGSAFLTHIQDVNLSADYKPLPAQAYLSRIAEGVRKIA